MRLMEENGSRSGNLRKRLSLGKENGAELKKTVKRLIEENGN